MASHRFLINSNLWAERDGNQVKSHKTIAGQPPTQEDAVSLELGIDTLRNLLVWADQERGVTASLTGPMAVQVRKAAKELGPTPEMLVWHAAELFLAVGAG